MSVPEETKESTEPVIGKPPNARKRTRFDIVAGAHIATLSLDFGESRESKMANYEPIKEVLLELYDTREAAFKALITHIVAEFLSTKEISEFNETPYASWEAKFKGLSVKLADDKGWHLEGTVGFAVKRQRVVTDDSKE